MLDLQKADQELDQQERRRDLTLGLSELEQDRPSSELVALPAPSVTALTRLVENSVSPTDEADREEKAATRLQESRTSSHIAATRDFRNSRTFPFAGLGGAVVGLWALRVPLGITDLSFLTPVDYFLGASVLLIVIAVGYFFANRSQRRDEQVLDALYDPDVQDHALEDVVARGDLLFHSSRFERSLEIAASYRFRRRLPVRRRSLGSKVDLNRALRDATLLGLDRFVAAGILRRVKAGVSTVYEVPVARDDSRADQ